MPPHADLILQLPRPLRGIDDFRAWVWEKSGIFSVRPVSDNCWIMNSVNNSRPVCHVGKMFGVQTVAMTMSLCSILWLGLRMPSCFRMQRQIFRFKSSRVCIQALGPWTFWTRLVNKKDPAVIVSVMWAIRSSRNKYTHQAIQYQPLPSMHLVEEFVKALEVPQKENCDGRSEVRWRPPNYSGLKSILMVPW